ncbi:MAG: DUF5658 family protein [Acidobacteriota bacterium]|nr:DUF5658 family protein [Acidobacteriota bacterium]
MTAALKADSNPNLLVNFFYLQVLDLLTTLAFLANGVAEANPVVRMSFHLTHSPLLGLLLIKAIAALFAGFCCYFGKQRLLERVNIGFAALVVWNLIALIVSKHAGAA